MDRYMDGGNLTKESREMLLKYALYVIMKLPEDEQIALIEKHTEGEICQ